MPTYDLKSIASQSPVVDASIIFGAIGGQSDASPTSFLASTLFNYMQTKYSTTPVSPDRGGTGVNNGTRTLTIGGNTAFSGAFTFTGNVTANTTVTFPTTGTLVSNTTLAQGQSGLVAYAAPGTGVENYYLGSNAAASLAANAANNIYFGNQAGRFKTTGSFNVGIGYFSQRNSSGVNGTGSGNVSIGYSLISATTGSNNAAIGYQNLFNVTTGSANVGEGFACGQAITTGSSNVAVGDNALFNLTTGSFNVAIGYFAGNRTFNSNEVFIGNTAGQLSLTGTVSFSGTTTNASNVITTATTVGVHVGQFVTGTGIQAGAIVSSFVANTSITMSLPATAPGTVTITCASQELNPSVMVGNSAGKFLRDGGNVCIGHNAGGGQATDSNQQAFRTVAVGRSALAVITNGPHNTAIGDAALSTLTTGGSNTAVGRGAGVRMTISGANSLFGHGAGFYLDPNAGSPYIFTPTNLTSQTLTGDCVYIGNSSGGSTALNTAATAITGFANIGIGTYTGPGVANVNATIAIGLYANPRASNTTIIGQLQTAALVSGNLASSKSISTINSATGVTLTVAQMFGGYVSRVGNLIGLTDTTPTATQIIASIPGAEPNSSYEFSIINGGSATVTIGAGTGVTLAGNTTVVSANTRRYAVVVTNVAPGSEAVTLLGLSTAGS